MRKDSGCLERTNRSGTDGEGPSRVKLAKPGSPPWKMAVKTIRVRFLIIQVSNATKSAMLSLQSVEQYKWPLVTGQRRNFGLKSGGYQFSRRTRRPLVQRQEGGDGAGGITSPGSRAEPCPKKTVYSDLIFTERLRN